MATINVDQFNRNSFTEYTFPFHLSNFTYQSQSATQIVVTSNFDPLAVTTIFGTGFTFDGAGNPTGGTFTNIDFAYGASGATSPVAALSGANVDLVDFLNAINDPTAFSALFASYDVVFDATGSTEVETYFSGTGVVLGDTAIAGSTGSYMELGSYADTYVGGAGFDQISFAREDGVNGVVANLSTGMITDTYGNIETVSGQFESLRGSINDDSLTGDAIRQHFRGLAGDDTIDGGLGTDLVRYDRDANYGGSAGVTVNLQTGIATDGFGDTDTLISIEDVRATNSADLITGSSGDNYIQTYDGNDTVNGGAGSDTIDGGDGNDVINPGDNNRYDRLFGSRGDDQYIFSDANPNDARYDILYRNFSQDLTFDIDGVNNTGSIDKGVDGFDTLIDVNAALISSNGGFGLEGGLGNDTFNIAHDSSASHWTQVTGRQGNDVINISGGYVRVNYYEASFGINADLSTGIVQDGSGGTDTITGAVGEVQGSDFADAIVGSANDESFIGRQGNDTIDGGAGYDRIRYDRDGVENVFVDLEAGVATGDWDGSSFTHSLSNIEAVRGSRTDDNVLLGSVEDERFYGYDGDDFFNGREGDDTFLGGAGFDTVSYEEASGGVAVYLQLGGQNVGGGEGRDTLDGIEGLVGSDHGDRLVGTSGDNMFVGGDGDDTIRGKDGNDSFDGGTGNDNIRGGAGEDDMQGGSGSDIVVGLNGNDLMDGADGDDFLYGGRDNDTIEGGSGDDVLRGNRNNDELAGGLGSDSLYGGGNNDILMGGADRDYLLGENGNDTLNGQSGDDNLTGGDGADVFVMEAGSGYDRVLDFDNGTDLIDVTAFGITDYSGINASQVGSGVRIAFGGGDTLLLQGNQFAILDSSDFIFA